MKTKTIPGVVRDLERLQRKADADAVRGLAEQHEALRQYLANVAASLLAMSAPRESEGWSAVNEMAKEIGRRLAKDSAK